MIAIRLIMIRTIAFLALRGKRRAPDARLF